MQKQEALYMNTYLRNKPPWVQLIIFLGLTGGIWALVIFGGAYVVAFANGLSPFQVASMSAKDYAKPELVNVVRGMLIVQFLMFVLPPLVFAYLADPRPMGYIGLKAPDKKHFLFWGIVIIVFAFLMVEWLYLVNQELVNHLGKAVKQWIENGESEKDDTIGNIVNMKNFGDFLLSVLFVGVLAAVGEEIFFRGILQRLFIQLFRSPWSGIIFTGAIFSAIHGQFMGFIPRMILGVILGALYWYSGSILTAIIGHFVFNSITLFLIYFKLADMESKAVLNTFNTLVGIGSLAVVIFLLNYLRKQSVTSYEGMFLHDEKVDS